VTFQPIDDDGEAQTPRPAYDVGYGKPPANHQFKKGRSGNPRGRPRKQKVTNTQGPNSFGGQPANQYLLQEAYRPVVVREGEQTIELPAIQAVFRAMGVAAMKGNRFAQRTIAELVQSVETEDRKLQLEHLETMINYKVEWERAIERARALGQPEPQPIPHPDDVIIDFRSGHARVCGPLTKDDKATWDRLLEYRDELQGEISYFAAAYRKSRSADRKAHALDMWMFEQKLYDRMNDNLPKRYRKDLTDRCREQGASRAGQQRKARWAGDD
jgi:Family of unknown function (DUF5681)